MNKKSILLFPALFFMALSMSFNIDVLPSFANTIEPIIIANPKVSDQSLNSGDVKNIFLGKKTKWKDGNPIILVILKEKDTHKQFLAKYVKFTPSQFDRYWKTLAYSGRGKYPKKLPPGEALEYIAATDGAIGYVASSNDTVKTLCIK